MVRTSNYDGSDEKEEYWAPFNDKEMDLHC